MERRTTGTNQFSIRRLNHGKRKERRQETKTVWGVKMKKVRITKSWFIGDAGGEGTRHIAGNMETVSDEVAAMLFREGAAVEVE
jgi:hypothetical protein